MKTMLALAALVFSLSGGNALACDDPNCPHGGGGKPPKAAVTMIACDDPNCPHGGGGKPPKATVTIACDDPNCPHGGGGKPPKAA